MTAAARCRDCGGTDTECPCDPTTEEGRYAADQDATHARIKRARTASGSKSSVVHADRKANGHDSSSLMNHAHAAAYGLDFRG